MKKKGGRSRLELGPLRRLGQTCVGGCGHLALERHEDVVEGLGAARPVGDAREARLDAAVALVDAVHVDLRHKADLRGDLRVRGAAVDLQEVQPAIVVCLCVCKKKKNKMCEVGRTILGRR